jgi:hypothetical protein
MFCVIDRFGHGFDNLTIVIVLKEVRELANIASKRGS